MKQGPQVYFADDITNDWPLAGVQHPEKGTVWVKARPLSATWHDGLLNRLRLAWSVFTGDADVLKWRQQP